MVQASISDILGTDNSIRRSVFHVNSQNFEVRSADTIHPDTIRYTQSLENILFSIVKYTASEPKFLQQGIKWGEVTEYLDSMQINPYMEVLSDDLNFTTTQNMIDYSQNKLIRTEKTFDVYKIGYEIDIIDKDQREEDTNNVTNYYLISSQFSFPVSGTLYSPAHVVEPFKEYEFELTSFISHDLITEDNTIEENNILIDDMINDSVDDVIYPVIEENIVTDDVIEEENVVDKVMDDHHQLLLDHDTTDEIITEADERITIDKVIEEDDIIVIENMDDSEIHDDYDSKEVNNSFVPNMIGLVLLLLVISIGGFVYYKKYKNNNLKSHVSSNSKSDSIIKTVHFDDHVTIKINCKEP